MHRLTTHAELLEASGGDPWVRWVVDPALPGEVWVHADIALVQRLGVRPGFWVAPLRSGMPRRTARGSLPEVLEALGEDGLRHEAAQVREALVALRDGGHLQRLRSLAVSVPQEHAPVVHEVLDLAGGGDWEWMWTGQAPPRLPLEEQVVVLDDTLDAEELTAFSHRHNPRVWTSIGTGQVARWVGLRDGTGALRAVGGAEREDSGAAHLAGIVTATDQRGQGLGSVVSAALTRWAVAERGVCTLGMFSDNATARRVYHRLGYRTARAWHSRRLAG